VSTISKIEIGAFTNLFNRDGYVLNFSTNKFDVFTQNSVGMALCDHYGMSKGKSLTAYVNEANNNEVVKLLGDLLEYYELHYQSEIQASNGDIQNYYNKCREIMNRVKLNQTPLVVAGEILKEKFSSDYMSAQIDIMLKMQTENPTEAIGKSKELIESCCKTILEGNRVAVNKNWTVSQLVKETMTFLQVSTDNVGVTTTEASTVKAVLGNLHGIAGNIAKLRNAYGSGHGKGANFKGLTVRHAKLAVGSSVTLVTYLWETYEWRVLNNNPAV